MSAAQSYYKYALDKPEKNNSTKEEKLYHKAND